MRFRQIGDNWGICETLSRLAGEWQELGDFARTSELQDEGIRLARESGNKSVLAWLLFWSGHKNWFQGTADSLTQRLYEESLALFRELRLKNGVSIALCQLGRCAHRWGNDERARALLEQSIMQGQQVGNTAYVGFCLIDLAEIFCVRGEPERGARLLGAVTNPLEATIARTTLCGNDTRKTYQLCMASIHAKLDEMAFAAAFAEGQTMSLDQAIADALGNATYEES